MTSEEIKAIIDDNECESIRRYSLWSEYDGEVAIFNRKQREEGKSDNRISVPFRSTIVDQMVSYLLGNPIKYGIDKPENKYTDEQIVANEKLLNEFNKFNNVRNKDKALAEFMSICGVGYRLIFFDDKGQMRFRNPNPWECIVEYDATTEEVIYGIIYCELPKRDISGKITNKKYVEVYESDKITFYEEGDKGKFTPVKEIANRFAGRIPLIQFNNNNTLKGDFERVGTMVDNLDVTISDTANEVGDSALSTLVITGVDVEEDKISSFKGAGTIVLDGEGKAKVEFLQRHVNNELSDISVKRIENYIYKHSSTVDMSDENFSGGTQSGESRKWKLFALEQKIKGKELEMCDGFNLQYRVCGEVWKALGTTLDVDDITYGFTRSIPVDMTQAVENNAKMYGMGLSDEYRLMFMPGMDNIQAELELQRKEAEAKFNVPTNIDTTNTLG